MDLPPESFDLEYRLATHSDFNSVYDLYMDRVSNPYLTYDHMTREEFESIYEELLDTKTLYIVESNQRVVASYRLTPKTDRQAHTIYLGGFVVSHSMKGKGIGTTILNHIKKSSVDDGKMRIELTVDINNENAINLYKKVGFIIEGRIRKSYRRSATNVYYDEYLMGLIL
jgi:RimJ/RimL family protein N-acetyltransferase